MALDELPMPATISLQDRLAALEAWLCLEDDAKAQAYLHQHVALLCASETKVIFHRWIAHAPPALAMPWSQRLHLLEAYHQ